MSNRRVFFMVYLANGNNPTYMHTSLSSAEAEAKRLAKKTNRKAYVLCSIKSFEVNEFNIEDCRPETDDLPF